MDSRILTGLALLLLAAAVATGLVGYRLSNARPEPVAAPQARGADRPEATLRPVVVARRDLGAGDTLADTDLELQMVAKPGDGALSSLDDASGRLLRRAVNAGARLSVADLAQGSALARLLRPDERAVAVAVDEVIAGGGWLAPGDFVDVIAYIRSNQSGGRGDVAQVVLERVRVLSYGGTLEPERARDSAVADAGRARSAVLAVPAGDAPRLLLAESVGRLRLAVRSSIAGEDGGEAGRTHALSDLLPAPRASQPAAAPKRPSVTVHRGGASQREGL